SLDVIGVTGTNGKTTTVALLRHLMNVQGSAGSIGTLGAIDGAGEMLSGYGDLTTPGSIEVHAVLAELRARGVRSVAIEASSHALDQNRLALIALRGAVFTNLTHDHLDYHGSMDRYRAAKGRLSDLLASGAIEVVNEDDPAWQVLGPRDGVRRIGFGRRAGGEVQARDVRLEATGSSAVFSFAGEDCPVRVPLLGDFNVENALAAAAAAWGLGGEPTTIAERLATMPPVTGRLEPLHSGAFQVHRDYCHTPDALERAIAVLRPLTAGRLIVLFGAGGDRDRSKRASMGRVVEQGADLAIVTSDNPRTEDPERIVDEIAAGMSGRRQVRIVDRLVAIEYAVGILEAGDCLLLAGKGHEDYQVVGTERYPFDERTIVRSLMREPEE
ncbi:MAG: UDP-N-acetylmuramoyl-L-alanyl-D-glutamate--2,6-diaminopimelate ligase, partial [Gemmatimonadales bacterium]